MEALHKTGHIDAAIIFCGYLKVQHSNVKKDTLIWICDVKLRLFNLSGVFQILDNAITFIIVTQETWQMRYPQPLNQSWKKKVIEIAAYAFAYPSTRARLSSSVDSVQCGKQLLLQFLE